MTVANVQDIGYAFLKTYYQRMHNDPSKLYHLYSSTAELTHINYQVNLSEKGDVLPTVKVIGKENISKFYSRNNKMVQDVRVKIDACDFQSTGANNTGILVLALGEIYWSNTPTYRFCQTFILNPVANNNKMYDVTNDIMRFIPDVIKETIRTSSSELSAASAVSEAPAKGAVAKSQKPSVGKEEVDTKVEKKTEQKRELKKDEAKDTRDTKDDSRETKDVNEAKEAKETKESKDHKESKEPKETKEPKVSKDTKESKEPRDSAEFKEPKETKDNKDTSDSKDMKDTKESKKEATLAKKESSEVRTEKREPHPVSPAPIKENSKTNSKLVTYANNKEERKADSRQKDYAKEVDRKQAQQSDSEAPSKVSWASQLTNSESKAVPNVITNYTRVSPESARALDRKSPPPNRNSKTNNKKMKHVSVPNKDGYYPIYIRNTGGITNKELTESLEREFGTVIKISAQDSFAVVDFEDPQCQQDAIRMNALKINNTTVYIGPKTEKKRGPSLPSISASTSPTSVNGGRFNKKHSNKKKD
ncbi:HDL163Wp [Eremothecium sinecaudum]|uniref:HDL163Wp n=1 Tax=Eremothecium sinecaudum TaxID=45286 RepID=A0A109UX05_9SACH|nr:HDL163Wp [Eremothecium sinecaudum]AMD20581.1 HDL163Wp [Eremothecium sinecaudum]